jgi:hypothetical protein
MSAFLLIGTIGAVVLAVVSIGLVAVVSLRALRRGAGLEAEMKAAAFAFRLHLEPRAGMDAHPEALEEAGDVA